MNSLISLTPWGGGGVLYTQMQLVKFNCSIKESLVSTQIFVTDVFF